VLLQSLRVRQYRLDPELRSRRPGVGQAPTSSVLERDR
jgi:hypothetical protein